MQDKEKSRIFAKIVISMTTTRQILAFLSLFLFAGNAFADDEPPVINPTATYTSVDGEVTESAEMSGQAPLKGYFQANASNVGDYTATYEWRFTCEGSTEPYLTRYEENTEYTFTKAGSHSIMLYATFTKGNDVIQYGQEYWSEQQPLRVTISESKLEMPNAFSPNGDGINDIYKAKDGYQSLTEFHAYIFNRWGQKLYEWTNPADGWDGKYKGKDVAQGVYYVLVKAKGADGKTYNIKRDVNLLRGYTEGTNTGGGTAR